MVRYTRPNDTMSKAVMAVISGLLGNRRSYYEGGNRSVWCAIKSLICEKVFILTLLLYLEPQKILT